MDNARLGIYMDKITIEEAQAHLVELIEKLPAGHEIVITRNNQPIAQLVSLRSAEPHPVPGRCKGMLTIVSENDDHHGPSTCREARSYDFFGNNVSSFAATSRTTSSLALSIKVAFRPFQSKLLA